MFVEAQTGLTAQTCTPCSECKLLNLSKPPFPHLWNGPDSVVCWSLLLLAWESLLLNIQNFCKPVVKALGSLKSALVEIFTPCYSSKSLVQRSSLTPAGPENLINIKQIDRKKSTHIDWMCFTVTGQGRALIRKWAPKRWQNLNAFPTDWTKRGDCGEVTEIYRKKAKGGPWLPGEECFFSPGTGKASFTWEC